ncbi:right-handed parallel beta-helix repeat-containing protein [Actinomadura oligospora]|uniref:right-handed parallel beta-helix repeat-containing protein n=1 Tax=Actinomadura oligospora TaxID=111804 RepID=UPI000687BAA5|nr:right-handed parallel beta-helix repeat-containing protein [Actinomadura oligospora]
MRISRTARVWMGLAITVPVVAGGVIGWQQAFQDDPESRPRAVRTSPAPQAEAGAGSLPVGRTSYRIPHGAVIVAPNGSDAASGSPSAPLRTLAAAITRAPEGGTIVLRRGVYHESVTVPQGRRLTIQAHPGEAVWLDGSSRVTAWKRSGLVWAASGWTYRFDASPSYTKGAGDGTDEAFKFLDPAFPMASHPEQVWVDGVAQRQVASAARVGPGTFFADLRGRRLLLGSDPSGHEVRASTLEEAVTLGGAGSVLRGVGVRRYATSIPQLGTVKVLAANVTVENLTVTDSASTGLSVDAPHARLRGITALRSGMLGMHANYADDLRIENVLSRGNNTEHFRPAPVSGGIKITRTRKVAVVGGVVADNRGKGLWFDESVQGITVTGLRVVRNTDHGLVLELCAQAVVADNVVGDNGEDGLKINDTSFVRVWNNTLTRNGRDLHLIQDHRADDPTAPAHATGSDPRRPPDRAMTWRIGQITIANNLIALGRDDSSCLLCVEDTTRRRDASQMGLTVNGNAYSRRDADHPRALVVWPTGKGDPKSFEDKAAFRDATGQERSKTPLPLPADIATLLKKPTGTTHQGAWRT